MPQDRKKQQPGMLSPVVTRADAPITPLPTMMVQADPPVRPLPAMVTRADAPITPLPPVMTRVNASNGMVPLTLPQVDARALTGVLDTTMVPRTNDLSQMQARGPLRMYQGPLDFQSTLNSTRSVVPALPPAAQRAVATAAQKVAADSTRQPPKAPFMPLIPAPVPFYDPPAPRVFNMGPGGTPMTGIGAGGVPPRALPPGPTPPPGRVFNMPPRTPGTAVVRVPPGAAGAGAAGAGAAGAGAEVAAAAEAASIAQLARTALPFLAEGAGVLGGGYIAGTAARDAANDPNSRFGRRIAQAAEEMQRANREGASTGRMMGIGLRNAAAGAGESVLAGLGGLIPTEFLSGLFGLENTPAAAAAPKPPTSAPAQGPGEAAFLARARAGALDAARNAQMEQAAPQQYPMGESLKMNQLLAFLEVMPRMSGGGGGGEGGAAATRGPKGKDLMYERLVQMMDKKAEGLSNQSQLTQEEKQKLFNELLRDYQLLSGIDAYSPTMLNEE